MTQHSHRRNGSAPPERLDQVAAAAWPELSRSRLQALIREGHLEVDGRTVRDPSLRLPGAVEITLSEPPPASATPRPQAIPIPVVFEDDDLIVVDKPAGLVVHPGAGHGDGTLVNALLHHSGASLSGIGGVLRPGIVHRLDKDTSGLLVVAKTDRAHRGLADQFADHGRTGPLERAYLAFVWGLPEPRRGTVATDIARSPANREKMVVVAAGRGRHAITHYETLESYGPDGAIASLVRCRLETGRTHQIRVHLSHLRHPLLGDPLYGVGFRTKAGLLSGESGRALAALGRQALHAALLQFEHPARGGVLRFESALPADLQVLRRGLTAFHAVETSPEPSALHGTKPGKRH